METEGSLRCSKARLLSQIKTLHTLTLLLLEPISTLSHKFQCTLLNSKVLLLEPISTLSHKFQCTLLNSKVFPAARLFNL